MGTGENNSQRSVGYGDGVYKSTDGGDTWRRVDVGADAAAVFNALVRRVLAE